ncbi:MAG: GerW family sporulation protein [Clostridia bacterium]|nr:GerW family sporulation protein [Clostridia bacterium]
MEENHPIEELMVTAMNSIKQMIDANTIIGEPIKALNNTVIIPISKVGFGFAAGGSEFNDETVNSYNKKEKEEHIKYRLPFGGGSGAGVNISPVAFLIVQNDNVKLLEASHSSVLDKIVEYIPDAVEKINGIIKRKMDKNDGFVGDIDDDFDEESDVDDFDEDLNDLSDDDDWDDDLNETENETIKQVKEIRKEKVVPTTEEGEKKTKKLEKKIKEIKKENDE